MIALLTLAISLGLARIMGAIMSASVISCATLTRAITGASVDTPCARKGERHHWCTVCQGAGNVARAGMGYVMARIAMLEAVTGEDKTRAAMDYERLVAADRPVLSSPLGRLLDRGADGQGHRWRAKDERDAERAERKRRKAQG